MRVHSKVVAAVAATLAGAAAVTGLWTTAASASSSVAVANQPTLDGCPAGYVCIYREGVFPVDDPNPTVKFYTYGAHNLSNQYGYHYVVNNQTGIASFTLCTGYNGRGCTDGPYGAINYQYAYLTPINSIRLDPQ
jgi:hypothetical protein